MMDPPQMMARMPTCWVHVRQTTQIAYVKGMMIATKALISLVLSTDVIKGAAGWIRNLWRAKRVMMITPALLGTLAKMALAWAQTSSASVKMTKNAITATHVPITFAETVTAPGITIPHHVTTETPVPPMISAQTAGASRGTSSVSAEMMVSATTTTHARLIAVP